MRKRRARKGGSGSGSRPGGPSATEVLISYIKSHPKATYREAVEIVEKDGYGPFPIFAKPEDAGPTRTGASRSADRRE